MTLNYMCKICNKQFKSLGKHILLSHKEITCKEYYDTYLKKNGEGVCLTCGKQTSFIKLSKGYNKYCNKQCFYASDVVKQHREETVIKRTGVNNVFKSEEVKNKIKNTLLTKYGVTTPLKNKDIIEKCKQTCLQRYNCENPFQNENIKEKIKQTMKEHYDCEYNMQSKEIRSKAQTRYNYEGMKFDSAAELTFYIYNKDKNINIKRNTDFFVYYVNGIEHRYFPDFIINDVYYEIKGNHMISDDFETFLDPHTHKSNDVLLEKMKCLKKHNVKIILTSELQVETKYINNVYGKDYIKSFKRGIVK